MITTNRPMVENSRRPVSATITGRAKRLTRTRIAAQDTKPTTPVPRDSTIGAESVPNGNGWETVMKFRMTTMTTRMTASIAASTMKRRIRASPRHRA
jgi:hypothetical protein